MGKGLIVVDDYYCFCNNIILLSFDEYVSVSNTASVLMLTKLGMCDGWKCISLSSINISLLS